MKRWAIAAGIAGIYFLAAKFGLSLAFVHKQVTAVWPPTGIAVAALLIFGLETWPGIAAGAFLINALTGSPATAVGIAVGNTLEAVAAAALLRRVGFDGSLRRLRDVLGLVGFAGFIGPAVAATIGAGCLWLGGLPAGRLGEVWGVWWLGDALGALVVTPLLLTWAARSFPTWRARRLPEEALLWIGIFLVGRLVLVPETPAFAATHSLVYLVFPFIIWAALRFGQRETATVVFVVAAMALWGAVHSVGPFAVGTANERLNMLQAFMGVVAVTALVLGAATAERKDALERLRAAEETVRGANAALERKVEARTKSLESARNDMEEFSYTVSHDLRTPLRALEGYARMIELKARDLSEESREYLKRMRDSVTRLDRLTMDVLTFSRIPRLAAERSRVALEAIVLSSAEQLRASRPEAEILVRLPVPDVTGQESLVVQCVTNLMTNAVSYVSPEVKPEVEVWAERPREGAVKLLVRDNGVGIAPEHREAIFKPFVRLAGGAERAHGTGIGLAIVKKAAERMGGRVGFSSTPGAGSTFWIELDGA